MQRRVTIVWILRDLGAAQHEKMLALNKDSFIKIKQLEVWVLFKFEYRTIFVPFEFDAVRVKEAFVGD